MLSFFFKCSWQSTGFHVNRLAHGHPPSCTDTTCDNRFSIEGRDIESICRVTVLHIDKCLEETAELVKSIQLSLNGQREPIKQELKTMPTNQWKSKWLQHNVNLSDQLEVESPVMCNL